MRTSTLARLCAAAAAAALLGACSTPDEEEALSPSAEAGSPSAGSGGVGDVTSIEYFNQVVGDRVFFATDRFDLDGDAQATLARQAEWLRANPGATATVEGHADERGTRAYNLALGARRANAARSFLIGRGVEAGRLRAVSYGKERPVSLCSEERCWSQNRRAVSVIVQAPTS